MLPFPSEALDPSDCPEAHGGTNFAAGVNGYMYG